MDTKAGAGKYLPALQDKEMEEVMKEHICKDRDRCGNGNCNYRTAHNTYAHPQEHKPFNCRFLGGTQHCEPVNKEEIMEDNRKGTWEDVTNECIVNDDGTCGFVEVRHNGTTVGWLGHRVEGSKFQKNYRMTSNLAPEDARDGDCGKFKVEHFTPDPEPVIAYKAVRVDEDGVMRSIMCGSDARWAPVGGHSLDYAVGLNVDGGQYGVFCFTTIEGVKDAYVIGTMPRSSRPLAILKVEAYGEPVNTSELVGVTLRGDLVSYPSVKVLSVAWEEEKKEEWVDVTAECKSEFNAGYVRITHNGNVVAELGQKSHDTEKDGYRVSSRPNTINRDHAGFITVEKRNG